MRQRNKEDSIVPVVVTGFGPARSGVTLMRRIRGNNGQLITQASITSIGYVVTNLKTGVSAASVSLIVADVVFDSLQTDARWTVDSTDYPGDDGSAGYNLRATIPASNFPVSTAAVETPTETEFQIDVRFVPTSGEAFVMKFKYTAGVVYA